MKKQQVNEKKEKQQVNEKKEKKSRLYQKESPLNQETNPETISLEEIPDD